MPRLINLDWQLQRLEAPVSNSILNRTSRVAIAGRIAECRRPQNWNELTVLGDYHLPFGKAEAQAKAARFSEPNARCKMPLLFYLPLITWTGLLDVAHGEREIRR